MAIEYVKALDGGYRKYWQENGFNMVKDIDENDSDMLQWVSDGNSIRDIEAELVAYEQENNLTPPEA
jgi:hypothetical protein